MVAAQVFTYSRGGWLAAGAGLISLALFRYPRALIVLALYVPFLLLPQGEVVGERIAEAATASDPASRLRLNEYHDAIGVIVRYPFFGAGFGSAPAGVPYLGVSSIYLYVAELTGLIGLALFLWTLLALARHAFPALFRSGRPGPTPAGIAASVCAGVTAGLVDHYFFNPLIPHTTALFWLFAGLLVVAVPRYAKN
jgi:O-antigen ligase